VKGLNVNILHSWKALAALSLLLAGVSQSAWAQQIYRIVGSNGRVTFTDVPPPGATSNKNVSVVGNFLIPGTVNTGGLPFELQQIVLKFPVVLYTANNCAVCTQGRNHLVGRGIPFAEKTVTTPEEIEAFLKFSGDSPMPYLTIGKESIKGYIEADWSTYLTAAAYPQSSQLPSNYKYASAAPLIERKAPEPAVAEAPAALPPLLNDAPAVTPDNPTGIKF
jgi:glutaredoxin